MAVNDSTVAAGTDRFDDQPMEVAVGPERLAYLTGNTVVLDLGYGYYATYAHLKRGSIKMKEGDQVSRGQVIAQVGNSGNTSGPHLHFHVTRGMGFRCRGMPYALIPLKCSERSAR